MNKTDRMVQTLAENYKDKKMTRKVDTWEYESLAECIRSDQVPARDIAEFLRTKPFINGTVRNILQKEKKYD